MVEATHDIKEYLTPNEDLALAKMNAKLAEALQAIVDMDQRRGMRAAEMGRSQELARYLISQAYGTERDSISKARNCIGLLTRLRSGRINGGAVPDILDAIEYLQNGPYKDLKDQKGGNYFDTPAIRQGFDLLKNRCTIITGISPNTKAEVRQSSIPQANITPSDDVNLEDRSVRSLRPSSAPPSLDTKLQPEEFIPQALGRLREIQRQFEERIDILTRTKAISAGELYLAQIIRKNIELLASYDPKRLPDPTYRKDMMFALSAFNSKYQYVGHLSELIWNTTPRKYYGNLMDAAKSENQLLHKGLKYIRDSIINADREFCRGSENSSPLKTEFNAKIQYLNREMRLRLNAEALSV